MYDLNIFNNSFKTPTLRFLFITNDKFLNLLKIDNVKLCEIFAGYQIRIQNSYSYWEANQLTFRV